jgi:hypothetical protein
LQVLRKLAAPGDGDAMTVDEARESLAGKLGDVGDLEQRTMLRFCFSANRLGEGVFGVALEAGGESEEAAAVPVVEGEDAADMRTAVGKSSGFVDDEDAAGRELFEDRWVFDEDSARGSDGDGPNDCDGDREQNRTGRGDDKYSEEAFGVVGEEPGEASEGEGERCVPAADAVADAADLRALLLGGVKDLDDAGVARIGGDASGLNGERRCAVDGSGEDGCAGGLFDEKRLSGELGLVHGTVA